MSYNIILVHYVHKVNVEGLRDENPLKTLVSKIIRGLNSNISDLNFITIRTDGSIDSKIKSAAFLFFNTHQCDLGIFLADTDGKPSKASRIRSKVTQNCAQVNTAAKYAIGLPNPSYEQWLLDEENSIKRIFHLPGNQKLPYDTLSPKERLEKIIDYHRSITVPPSEMYTNITRDLGLNKLCRSNRSFKSFYSSLQSAL